MPFLSFKNIQEDSQRCARVVPSEDFDQDVASGTLPTFMYYSPDLENDGHDSDLPTASAWLKRFLQPLLENQEFMDGTLIEVTFDESKTYLNNHIYTLFLGNMVKEGGREDKRLNHYDVLRTIEDNFAIGSLHAHDDKATPILDVWKDAELAKALIWAPR